MSNAKNCQLRWHVYDLDSMHLVLELDIQQNHKDVMVRCSEMFGYIVYLDC